MSNSLIDRRNCRRCTVLAVCISVLAGWTSSMLAQDIWEYSPYHVKVWVALDGSPELTGSLQRRVLRAIEWQAHIADASAWQVEASAVSPPWRQRILSDLGGLDVPAEADESHPMLQGDKLILVAVSATDSGYRVRARQLDCRLRSWGPIIEHVTWQPRQIPIYAGRSVIESFVPLVRIEKVRGKIVHARAKAAGLVRGPGSPAWIEDGTVLQPVIRRNDHVGNVTEDGIRPVDWTFLIVSNREGTRLECAIQSGMRSPISGRSSARIEKLALVARPRTNATVIRLESVGEDPYPLVGYAIHAQAHDSKKSQLLGVTDWRGEIVVSAADSTRDADVSQLTTLYVKSGTRFLARLPVIPGYEATMTALLQDDDPRLNAEGIITGLKNRFMDLIAQRQLMETRFRSLMEEGQYDQAERLVEQLRLLDSRPEFAMRLDQDEQQVAAGGNDLLQKRIDILFNDLRRLLSGHLDPQLSNRLAQELAAARQGDG